MLLMRIIKAFTLIVALAAVGSSAFAEKELTLDDVESEPQDTTKAKIEELDEVEIDGNNGHQAAPPSELIVRPNGKHSFTFGYWPSQKMKINFTATDGIEEKDGSYSINLKNSYSLAYDWTQIENSSWNNGVQIRYSRMDFKTTTLSVAGSEDTTTETAGNLSLLSVGYSGSYREKRAYFPIGIGLYTLQVKDENIPVLKGLHPGKYLSAGFGYMISSNYSAEIIFTIYEIQADRIGIGTVQMVPKTGNLSVSQANFRVWF